MDEKLGNEPLEAVKPDRRAFVKRVAAITAFAAPMVASYDLQALSSSNALAFNVVTLNQTQGFSSRH